MLDAIIIILFIVAAAGIGYDGIDLLPKSVLVQVTNMDGLRWVLAAFGAIIGGAIAQPRPAPVAPRAAGLNPRHYDWCQARYRSYDSYSNTFQPYNGPRQQCLSPYY